MNTTKFKVGDIVVGTSKTKYTITNSDSVCKVVDVRSPTGSLNDITVTIIDHEDHYQIGYTVAVHSDYFELAEKQYFNKLIDDYYAESN